jgi:hypothetical protein
MFMQDKSQSTSTPEGAESNSNEPVKPEVAAPSPSQKPYKKLAPIALVIILLVGGGYLLWQHLHNTKDTQAAGTTANANQQSPGLSQPKVEGLQLDTSKNYGNKYKDGILPVGDGKYTASGAKKGYVYVCGSYANNLDTEPAGAMVRGPWFTNNNQEYDISKKLHVEGSVMWTADFSMQSKDGKRVVITNDLPTHPTGIFPIAATDPAYSYDRNPNSIAGQTFTYSLDAGPAYSSTPNCIGGTVGIMLTGVQLNSAFDAGGRDAGAWEVQDGCNGHPQQQGVYHYHTLSSCIKDVDVSNVIGCALDGFPVTGPQLSKDNILTSGDLDECHGIVSQITLDGKKVTMYHYVMTEDFPYSISCYRGTAIQPPGLDQQHQAQQQGQIPNRQTHP